MSGLLAASTAPVGTRVASFDVGSNTVIMLVVERGPEGWRVVTDEAEITRVSQGLDQHGLLFREGLERTAEKLSEMAETASSYMVDHVVATGTAPFRRARNGAEAAAELSRVIGAPLDVVTGEHEARLSLLATRGSFPGLGDAWIVDIGGASTEVILSRADGSHEVVSIDVGSVRLTERCVTRDPIPPEERDRIEAEVASALDRAGVSSRGLTLPLVGVAGTVTSLAQMSLELEAYDAERVHGHHLALGELLRLETALFALTLRQRVALPGMPAKRADVLPAGATLLRLLAVRLGVDEVIVSDRGIRWGRLFERFGV